MSPILVPSLVALRSEFNTVSPGRDKRSDGWLGDRAHALTPSDHNPDETGRTPYEDADHVDEVHAIDIDDSGPWPRPGWFDETIERIRTFHQQGKDNRLQNIIRNRRVASRSWGWTWRPYDGSNPHTEHAHFSARYTTAQERDTSPWGVAMLLTDDDKQWIKRTIEAAVEARMGDIVQRYRPDGSRVPADDPNPFMTVASGVQYCARDTGMIRHEIEDIVIPALQRIEVAVTKEG